MGCITLTTDFGTSDHYVGVMKGVIHAIAPEVQVIDITHEVPAHGVLQAAFILRQIWNWYPPETVHLVVVDPGVGSQRRILLGRYGGQYVIAPDNGLISLVHHEVPIEGLQALENARFWLPVLSSTFHGRDIMAPVAAHLAQGHNPRDLGPTTDHLEIMQIAQPISDMHLVITGAVLYVDCFGNLVTNIRREDLARTCRRRIHAQVYVENKCVGPLRTCYGDVGVGKPLALVGSSDYLEISVNQGRAVDVLDCGVSAKVTVK
ncbi:MAG: SAM-dependent chlorinase/fluorinase [Phycisphaerae bacterium]|nr:SAM-dependent chlorinase/fluorinase [Phycisphaerae bacterium]